MKEEYDNELIKKEYLSKIESVRNRLDECEKNISIAESETENFNYINTNIQNIVDQIRMDNRSDSAFIKELDVYLSELEEAKRVVDRNFEARYEEFIHQEKELMMYEQDIVSEYTNWMNSLDFDLDMNDVW